MSRKDLFLTALIDRAQAAQDRIEARARGVKRPDMSEDYKTGLAVGGSLGSMLGVVTSFVLQGAL